MAVARLLWRDWQKTCDPARLIFLDETGAGTDMTRRHGRCPVGERCHDHAPGGHWKTMTFVDGLHLDGLVAPWCLDAPMNGTAFLAYVQTQLCPALKQGDIVVCDNLGSHKVAGVREMIEDKGARILYLPPILPTSTPSSRPSPKSKPFCIKPPNDPLMLSGPPSAASLKPSGPRNAATTSPTPDMCPTKREML